MRLLLPLTICESMQDEIQLLILSLTSSGPISVLDFTDVNSCSQNILWICLYLMYINTIERLIDWCPHHNIKLWPQLEQAQSDIPLSRAPYYKMLPSPMKKKIAISQEPLHEFVNNYLRKPLFTPKTLHFSQFWEIHNFHQVSIIELFKLCLTLVSIGPLTFWQQTSGCPCLL